MLCPGTDQKPNTAHINLFLDALNSSKRHSREEEKMEVVPGFSQLKLTLAPNHAQQIP
jgi:hypothetical protein